MGVAQPRRRLGRLAAVLAVAALWPVPVSAAGQAPSPTTTTAARKQPDEQKLREEIRKLRLENDDKDSLRATMLAYAPFVTALVAVAGVVIPIWTQSRERNRQLRLDREQRERELTQQQIESQRRFDDQFAKAVENLGSENEAVQTGAAVSLASFLRPEYKVFHEQVFRLLCANLQVRHKDVVSRLLLEGFEQAIRLHLETAAAQGLPTALDLARCGLERVDLSDLDLSGVDIAFANLRGANLTGATLERARGIEVNLEKARLSRANLKEARLHKAHARDAQFHDAKLISGELRDADLRQAEFFRAELQSAHLDRAQLQGAKFEQANLSDAFFSGATLDAVAKRSIVRAKNWRQANYDDDVLAQLEELARS